MTVRGGATFCSCSCSDTLSQAKQGITSKEIALESAAGHQLFFKPMNVWVEPVISWLKK
ncbi:hypothetical protein Gbem_4086 [Citrifermentans bemidjiense Bem]|uniref:Uncharacterized protein n=1 Tax=Citrifermentans bemidjiense (strain ATCC BAA-1014 / DSM 16622 / JCM 12645 / Bem) TaxID=404380 RepID=E1P692_CITBB|nr:hypothetical protein Gbem_4086 [Citrifermentans bemidjiense Bem]